MSVPMWNWAAERPFWICSLILLSFLSCKKPRNLFVHKCSSGLPASFKFHTSTSSSKKLILHARGRKRCSTIYAMAVSLSKETKAEPGSSIPQKAGEAASPKKVIVIGGDGRWLLRLGNCTPSVKQKL
ncbi:hypothetical protein ACH5RR_039847 [Cinchona calisaya]|uniref:Uncharacterized protein n=1 Tax=Cinchona calisaya TaxID=153742 RepID=A0ABD2Y2Z3_9GENT